MSRLSDRGARRTWSSSKLDFHGLESKLPGKAAGTSRNCSGNWPEYSRLVLLTNGILEEALAALRGPVRGGKTGNWNRRRIITSNWESWLEKRTAGSIGSERDCRAATW